jgi:hypothetical protein
MQLILPSETQREIPGLHYRMYNYCFLARRLSVWHFVVKITAVKLSCALKSLTKRYKAIKAIGQPPLRKRGMKPPVWNDGAGFELV